MVKNRIIDVIIDDSSYENIQQADCWGPKVTCWEAPPTLDHWLDQMFGGQISVVTERHKVSFSIGKYENEVYCDVVDMDEWQLLFGCTAFGRRQNLSDQERSQVYIITIEEKTLAKSYTRRGKTLFSMAHLG